MAVWLTYPQQYHLKLLVALDEARAARDLALKKMVKGLLREEGLRPFEERRYAMSEPKLQTIRCPDCDGWGRGRSGVVGVHALDDASGWMKCKRCKGKGFYHVPVGDSNAST